VSGIDEQVQPKTLICVCCGGGLSTRFFDSRSNMVYWIDNRLREVDGKIGYRTANTCFNDWGSIDYIMCADCGCHTPADNEAGGKLLNMVMKTERFGCGVR